MELTRIEKGYLPTTGADDVPGFFTCLLFGDNL